MENQTIARVRSHPKFAELIEKRSKYAWSLSIVMLAIYYGFVLVVAFTPQVLGIPIAPGAVTTVGIPIGVLIIVRRANAEFDALVQQVIEASK